MTPHRTPPVRAEHLRLHAARGGLMINHTQQLLLNNLLLTAFELGGRYAEGGVSITRAKRFSKNYRSVMGCTGEEANAFTVQLLQGWSGWL